MPRGRHTVGPRGEAPGPFQRQQRVQCFPGGGVTVGQTGAGTPLPSHLPENIALGVLAPASPRFTDPPGTSLGGRGAWTPVPCCVYGNTEPQGTRAGQGDRTSPYPALRGQAAWGTGTRWGSSGKTS